MTEANHEYGMDEVPSVLPMTGFFVQTLTRTREKLAGAIGGLVHGPTDERKLEELEAALLSSDVGPTTTERLVEAVRAAGGRGVEPRSVLRSMMLETLAPAAAEVIDTVDGTWVCLVVGVNGSGKTTTAAKLACRHKAAARRVLLASADTFRAAAVEQLKIWGDRLEIPVIGQRQGGDPAAVVFDACKSARARDSDVLIIDTAGRLHTQGNLMTEFEKMRRIAGRVIEGAPHEVLLVIDGTTGQNGVRQAEKFLECAGATGLVLAKLDGTARGGVALTIARRLGLQIHYVGTGEQLDDLEPFDAAGYVDGLLGYGVVEVQ